MVASDVRRIEEGRAGDEADGEGRSEEIAGVTADGLRIDGPDGSYFGGDLVKGAAAVESADDQGADGIGGDPVGREGVQDEGESVPGLEDELVGGIECV